MKTIKDIEDKKPVMAEFLNKMFEYSKTDIQYVDFDMNEWYMEYTYKKEDEQKFREYLTKNIKDYKELFDIKFIPTNKKGIESMVSALLLQWGLRVESKN